MLNPDARLGPRIGIGGSLAARRAGGGRRALCDTDPGLVPALKRLVQPATLGDPMRPLIWVSKSLEKLAAALTEMGHPIGPDTVRKELVKLGFSRQSNRKADEGSHHPDRNAQFEYINAKVVAAQVRQQPVISVDTKKKELIGNFKNGGTDYRPKRKPRRVNVHDFEDKKRALSDILTNEMQPTIFNQTRLLASRLQLAEDVVERGCRQLDIIAGAKERRHMVAIGKAA